MEEIIFAALRTAASTVTSYVAITVGVVNLFTVLDNRPVTVISAPKNPRNLLQELRENGRSISQPFL